MKLYHPRGNQYVGEQGQEKEFERRKELCKAAFKAVLFTDQRDVIGRKLYFGEGVWWDELGPLTPKERADVLKELRHIYNIPQKPQT